MEETQEINSVCSQCGMPTTDFAPGTKMCRHCKNTKYSQRRTKFNGRSNYVDNFKIGKFKTF